MNKIKNNIFVLILLPFVIECSGYKTGRLILEVYEAKVCK